MAYKDPEVGHARERERFRKRTAERRAASPSVNCTQPAVPPAVHALWGTDD